MTVPILPIDASPEDRERADAYAMRIDHSMKTDSEPSQASIYAVQYNQLDATITAVAYVVVFAWPVGVLFFVWRGFVSYLRFAWNLRSQLTINEQAVIDRLLRACDAVGVGRRPVMKQVDSINSPAVFGLWRPVICLPTQWRHQLQGEELDWVLKHELAHVKRRDGLVLMIASVARSIHWFHPISWIAVSRLRSRIEQAADEVATHGLTDSSVVQYGRVLLRYAELGMPKHRSNVVGLLAMASKGDLNHRIAALRVFPSRRLWLARICLFPFIACIAGAGLTDANISVPQAKERQRVPDFKVVLDGSDWSPRGQGIFSINSSEPTHAIEVNVEKAIQKATELQPRVDAESFMKAYFAIPYRGTATIESGVLKTTLTHAEERRMRERLTAFERSGLWQVAIECRLIETDVRLLSEFEWNSIDEQTKVTRVNREPMLEDSLIWQDMFANDEQVTPNESQSIASERETSMPLRATRVSENDFAIFIRRCQKDPRSNIKFAPKVTMFNGQSAWISDVVQLPFVTDVSLIKGNLASCLQPKISIFENGRKIWLKPLVTEQSEVDLQCVFTDSEVGEVRLATLPFTSPSDPDSEVTIQVPTVHSDSISVQTRLSDDEVLLVFSPTPYTQDGDSDRSMGRIMAIRTTLLPDDFITEFVEQNAHDEANSKSGE